MLPIAEIPLNWTTDRGARRVGIHQAVLPKRQTESEMENPGVEMWAKGAHTCGREWGTGGIPTELAH